MVQLKTHQYYLQVLLNSQETFTARGLEASLPGLFYPRESFELIWS